MRIVPFRSMSPPDVTTTAAFAAHRRAMIRHAEDDRPGAALAGGLGWSPGGGRPGRAPGPAGADARPGRQHAARPRPGQRIAVAPLVRPPARGDLVVVARPRQLEVVKRVVGLPGERVRLRGGGWRSTGGRPRAVPGRLRPAASSTCARAGGVPGARRPPGGQHRRPRLRARRGRRPPRPGPLRLLASTAPAAGRGCAERREAEEMMLVVVAGGAGFLGASLVDRLQAEGDELVVVDDLSHGHLANLAEARRRGGVRFHRMDVAQGGLATLADRVRADAWVHLATAIDPVRAWEDPTGEARAVVPGGIEVCGRRRPPGPGRCSSPPAPTSTRPSSPGRPGRRRAPPGAPLGRGQAGPGGLRRRVRGPRPGRGHARPRDGLRPRQDPLGPGLVARAAWTMLQNQPPRVDGDGRQERDFLFVDDAVDAVARAVHASPPPAGSWSAPGRRPASWTWSSSSRPGSAGPASPSGPRPARRPAALGPRPGGRRQGARLAAVDPPGRGPRPHRRLAQGPAARPSSPHRALTRPSLVIRPYVEFSS